MKKIALFAVAIAIGFAGLAQTAPTTTTKPAEKKEAVKTEQKAPVKTDKKAPAKKDTAKAGKKASDVKAK